MSSFQSLNNVVGSRSRSILVIASMALSLMACGRGTTVYSDPSANVATTPATTSNPPVTIVDGRNVLPKGFLDQSVNEAAVDLGLDGSNATNVAIRMQTKPVTNNPGGFNSANAVGNRALMGVSLYSKTALNTISALTFNGLVAAGTDQIGVVLQVDLKCDGTTAPRVFETSATALATGSTQTSNGYTSYNAGLDQSVWQVSGSSITDPNHAATVLVPSMSGNSVSSLTALIASYPQACIFNGSTYDNGLPNSLPVAGILFSLGSTSEQNQNTAFINHLVISSDIYDSSTWGTNQ